MNQNKYAYVWFLTAKSAFEAKCSMFFKL